MFDNFGVANSITEGFPQKFPFELKKPLQNISQVSGARLAGVKKYAKDDYLRKRIAKKGKSKYIKYFNSTKVAEYIINKTFENTYKAHRYLWEDK